MVIGSNYGDGSRGDNGEEETAREIALREERKIVLLHERKVLLQKTEQTVAAFDEAMYDLCREKLKLDADLKTAEMRMLTFLGELGMLSEFAYGSGRIGLPNNNDSNSLLSLPSGTRSSSSMFGS